MSSEPLAVRTVDDVATLRALSDPLRLAILRTFMADADRVLSVKELAAELGEPQTRLYRHVNHLEERGLLTVAETRVVSGIIEQRYRAGQRDLTLDGRLLARPEDRDDVASLATAAFDDSRNRLVRSLRAGQLSPRDSDDPANTPPDDTAFAQLVAKVTPERYRQLRAEFRAFVESFRGADDPGAGTVEVNLFAVLFPEPGPAGTAAAASPGPETAAPH